MEGFGKVKFSNANSAYSLIEVMVSMIIFSLLLLMSGKFVSLGMQRPFTYHPVEQWTTFIEITHQKIQQLPKENSIIIPSVIDQPFQELKYPDNLSTLRLTWVDSSISEYKVAHFTSTTDQGKTFEWRSLKKIQ